MPEPTEDFTEYVNEKQLRQRFIPVGARTLARMIATGQFPQADVRFGGKIRLWSTSKVRAFMKSHEQSEAVAG